MTNKYTAPQPGLDAFNCPYCQAFSHQEWVLVRIGYSSGAVGDYIKDLSISKCTRCQEEAIWFIDRMLHPTSSNAPFPIDDMPEDIMSDFVEARDIVNSSPRAATALLRLAVQKLMINLGGKGKNINDDIGNLVKIGLPIQIQKALDSLRVIGNNAIHPGELDLKDDMDTAISLFGLLNMIVEVMISQPKKVDEIFKKIPEGAKKAIKERNKIK